MMLDIVTLSRLQFALTIGFHYIYPPLSIGLGVMLVLMEGLYLKTGEAVYQQMTRFFVSLFALVFAIGVATGIVMEFEFGTNWAAYSRFVGDIFGSALASEGLFAFFMESGFLAILVFGWERVGKRVHFLSTVMVALGAIFSAVWIVAANSWMHTPDGYHIVGHGLSARAEVTDFWAMILNHSTLERLSHTLSASLLTGSTFVLSISAFYLLKGQHVELARKALPLALFVTLAGSLSQLATGHLSAIEVAQWQPAKLAAFEGHYGPPAGQPNTGPADLHLFGIVDESHQRVVGLGIPGGLSFLTHFDFSKPVISLNEIPPADRPPVQVVFQTYHLMIAIGMGLIALSSLGVFLLWRGRLYDQRWLLWLFVFSVLGPQIANEAGWATAEIGRQPWIVQGLLRTSQGVSQNLHADVILASLILFTLIYMLLFALFLYLLNDKIQHGPGAYLIDTRHDPGERGNPA